MYAHPYGIAPRLPGSPAARQERQTELQAVKETCSLLVLESDSQQLVVFPKQVMTGFEEVKELTGLFTLMKLLTLRVAGKLLLMYIYI